MPYIPSNALFWWVGEGVNIYIYIYIYLKKKTHTYTYIYIPSNLAPNFKDLLFLFWPPLQNSTLIFIHDIQYLAAAIYTKYK